MNKSCQITLAELIKIQYLVKSVKLNNNPGAKILCANNLTRTIGRGMEYAESRIYQPGDDVRHVDWRLTARHTKTYTKLYVEEKGENIYIVLDLTGSMYFGTSYALKSVIASQVAAMIIWLGFNEQNNIGSVVFNNVKMLHNPAKLSKSNILSIFNSMVTLHDPGLINYSAPGPSNNLLTTINGFEHLLAKNSRIFIISDFLNTDELLYQKIQKLKFNNLVSLIKISDPIEKNALPTGKYHISNGVDSSILSINKHNQELLVNYFQNKLANYNKLISKIKVRALEIMTSPEWHHDLIKKI